MGPEASNLAGSLAKSLDVDRSPNLTQRTSEIAQEQTAGAFVSALQPIKAEGADSLRRARLLQQRERRRREIERRASRTAPETDGGSDGEQGLDVMV